MAVQRRAGDVSPLCAVEPVPQQGQAYMGHVHTDLMGSACYGLQQQKGQPVSALKAGKAGNCLLPLIAYLPGDCWGRYFGNGGVNFPI